MHTDRRHSSHTRVRGEKSTKCVYTRFSINDSTTTTTTTTTSTTTTTTTTTLLFLRTILSPPRLEIGIIVRDLGIFPPFSCFVPSLTCVLFECLDDPSRDLKTSDHHPDVPYPLRKDMGTCVPSSGRRVATRDSRAGEEDWTKRKKQNKTSKAEEAEEHKSKRRAKARRVEAELRRK
ncbi:hypothetical protein ANTPLA_LOCUS1749 [Anthophora plagiata]